VLEQDFTSGFSPQVPYTESQLVTGSLIGVALAWKRGRRYTGFVSALITAAVVIYATYDRAQALWMLGYFLGGFILGAVAGVYISHRLRG
jgi:hypothetical protein